MPAPASHFASPPEGISAEEWAVRVDLATLYRLVALHGWDDLIYTHISARVPGTEEVFLINPYGMLFDTITASSLVRIDSGGRRLDANAPEVNAAGFVIHSAIHGARHDARFVLHIHEPYGIGVSAQREGLLPLSQHALAVLPMVRYHDFEGIALDEDERERIVADLGDGAVLILRNHGTLTLAADAGECWTRAHFLQRACKAQVLALSAGRDGVSLLDAQLIDQVREQTRERGLGGTHGWLALRERTLRLSPGFDA